MNTALLSYAFMSNATFDQEVVLESLKATTSSIHTLMTTVAVVLLFFGTAILLQYRELDLLGLKVQRKFLYPTACIYLSGAFFLLQIYLTKVESLLRLCTDPAIKRKALAHLFTDPSPFNGFAFSSIGREPILTERISSMALSLIFLASLYLAVLTLVKTFKVGWPKKANLDSKINTPPSVNSLVTRKEQARTAVGRIIIAILTAVVLISFLLFADNAMYAAKISVAKTMASISEYRGFAPSYIAALKQDKLVFDYAAWLIIFLLVGRWILVCCRGIKSALDENKKMRSEQAGPLEASSQEST